MELRLEAGGPAPMREGWQPPGEQGSGCLGEQPCRQPGAGRGGVGTFGFMAVGIRTESLQSSEPLALPKAQC